MAEKRKVAKLMALAVLATIVVRPMHRYEMASVMRARGKDRDMDIKWGLAIAGDILSDGERRCVLVSHLVG